MSRIVLSVSSDLSNKQEKTTQHTKKLEELSDELTAAQEANVELTSALESAQTDLSDALVRPRHSSRSDCSQLTLFLPQAREARQEESSRSLISAQRELEAAYDEAVAQLEAWKSQHGMESEVEEAEEEEGSSLDEEQEPREDAACLIRIRRSPKLTSAFQDTTMIHHAAAEVGDRPFSATKTR